MYDLLIVGAGVSAAAVCASLKHRLRICVLEIRDQIGGNCYDYASDGSYIHQYGPHIFHSTSDRVVHFLSQFTQWNPYAHSVEAEILDNQGARIVVPFPYSRLTERAMGRGLTEDEVLSTFFRTYSRKMWGLEWEDLPQSIKGRVPKHTQERPVYFPDQFVAMPKFGYTRMIENMFDGAEVILGAGTDEWLNVAAKHVLYCGRPDFIRVPGEKRTFGEIFDLNLDFRSLDITFKDENWPHKAPVLNICSDVEPYTRKTSYGRLTGGDTRIISCERPYQALAADPTPYYPIPLERNIGIYEELRRRIEIAYPNLTLCGRLGTYKYLDIFQAVAQAMSIVSKKLFA